MTKIEKIRFLTGQPGQVKERWIAPKEIEKSQFRKVEILCLQGPETSSPEYWYFIKSYEHHGIILHRLIRAISG